LAEDGIREVVEDFDEVGKLGHGFSMVDELNEIDIGNMVVHQPTYVNKNLTPEQKMEVCKLLKEFIMCFTWEYTEMPGLDKELVEHCLPIKSGFWPHRQSARNFSQKIVGRVNEEVDRLLKAGFIQLYKYAEWVPNIVLVEKKNTGKIHICVDFWDLNRATPKDEYPMSVPDTLINSASGNKIISFLDGNTGYNQIFMDKEDVHKTAFCCPGFVGLFEWVVMTFGLRNAGATYQRAMELIFHDLLDIIMKVYIDDVMIKSASFGDHLANLKVALERMKRYGLRMNPFK
jgi:hypothetical protein